MLPQYIDGYDHVFKYRQGGGGVSLLIINHINYKITEGLCAFNDDMETLFIEIDYPYFPRKGILSSELRIDHMVTVTFLLIP